MIETIEHCGGKRTKKLIVMAVGAAAFLYLGTAASAVEIWSGLDYYFEKPDGADWTLPENQDYFTDNVILTRADNMGISNIAQEDSYQGWDVSPMDTEWAFSGLNGNITFNAGEGAEQYQDLVFDDWVYALDVWPADYFEGTPGVVHLISDDIYVDILCDYWAIGGEGGQGGFAWYRGVPTPGALSLLAIAGLASRRRR
ncbi:MAG: hypothetical protein SYC29_04975 [Planctomycetota bacterium]|nr:hypothetical protein [Planctomycetota bacterium]